MFVFPLRWEWLAGEYNSAYPCAIFDADDTLVALCPTDRHAAELICLLNQVTMKVTTGSDNITVRIQP